jgi:hypothetical protein
MTIGQTRNAPFITKGIMAATIYANDKTIVAASAIFLTPNLEANVSI